MIKFLSRTGRTTSRSIIMYVSSWSDVFNTEGEMFFYSGDVKNLVDITLSEDTKDLEITYYQHNGYDFAKEFDLELEDSIKSILIRDSKIHNTRAFTFDLGNWRVVDRGDFNGLFIPDKNKDYYCFTFDTTAEKGGFPAIFIKDAPSSTFSEDSKIFPVQRFASHNIATVGDKDTIFGKTLTYTLIYSYIMGEFQKDHPLLNSVCFPSNPLMDEVPERFNTEALNKLTMQSGANKLRKKGKTVIDESDELPDFMLQTVEEEKVFQTLAKDIADKGSVSLSDMINYGVSETLEIIPDKNKIINIHLDIPEIARKACIFNNFVYYVPIKEKFDWEEFSGESNDRFIECATESALPQNDVKLLSSFIHKDSKIYTN